MGPHRNLHPHAMQLASAVLILLLAITAAGQTHAREMKAATTPALLAAISTAKAGDNIVLLNGVYTLRGSRGAECKAFGTAAAPIIVRSGVPLRAHIESDAIEAFLVSGANWRFEGLDIRGACREDSTCEHAFHVVGRATGFRLVGSRLADFNAHLKVNADLAHNIPNDGLVEGNEIYNSHPRHTLNPVTPLDIDNASRWIVRDNTIYDFHKADGDQISYGAFAKGGAKMPVFERNLVFCSRKEKGGGTEIGLSFGGGGMGAAQCPPAWNAAVPCDPETESGIMRNNIIINCSDVGIYLNRAKNSLVFYNTLVSTAGIDFRFLGSTGVAHGNLLSSRIRRRDGGRFEGRDNMENVLPEQFASWYRNPLTGDLARKADLNAIIGKGVAVQDVTDDYCGRPRTGDRFDLGALQASRGDCSILHAPKQ